SIPELLGAARIGIQSCIPSHFRQRSLGRANDRNTTCHRFQNSKTKTFVKRRTRIDIGSRIKCRHVSLFYKAGEYYLFADPEFPRQISQRGLAFVCRPGHYELRIADRAREIFESPQKPRMVFSGFEDSGVEHEVSADSISSPHAPEPLFIGN